jgi:PII-like signaling protein
MLLPSTTTQSNGCSHAGSQRCGALAYLHRRERQGGQAAALRGNRARCARAGTGRRDGAARALSQDLPFVIEIVDAEEKINAFVPSLEKIMGSGLVTLEKVKVLRYGNGDGAG